MIGPILWDFGRTQMSCWHDDHRAVWHGVSVRCSVPSANATLSTYLLEALLDEYTDMFSISTGLPPPRRHNHQIHLLPGTAPVAVRPYRYPQLLKDELERQCVEMLQQGIIQPSSSAFSSLVLLVKKHDGTWRFCVDYHALNSKMVCNMFPIPVVDELLDEL
jgi:hypothetical protein